MIAESPVRRRSVYADRLHEHAEFTFSDGAEFGRRGAWRDFLAQRVGPTFDGRVIFEIGCHDGGLVARVAARHPATAFVGIDWKCRALHAAAERVAATGLRNVALLHGRGQDLRRVFADAEVDEVWVFHPEPCERPKELPNRLIAEPFLRDVHAVLRGSGSLVLKTDHAEYHQWALDVSMAVADRFDVVAQSGDFWGDASLQRSIADRCYAGQSSAYEDRYRRKRRPIHYLELRKR